MPFDGQKLREWRLRRALTLRDLGALSGVAYDSIHGIETGKQQPRPSTVRKLAAALQHATSAEAPVVLRREVSVGHGARAVSRTVGLSADQLAFLARYTGLSPMEDDGDARR